MNIIITGASGFVGQNLSTYLEAGAHQIQKLSLRSDNWKESFSHTSAAIIHPAGKAHDTSNTSHEGEYLR